MSNAIKTNLRNIAISIAALVVFALILRQLVYFLVVNTGIVIHPFFSGVVWWEDYLSGNIWAVLAVTIFTFLVWFIGTIFIGRLANPYKYLILGTVIALVCFLAISAYFISILDIIVVHAIFFSGAMFIDILPFIFIIPLFLCMYFLPPAGISFIRK